MTVDSTSSTRTENGTKHIYFHIYPTSKKLYQIKKLLCYFDAKKTRKEG